MAVPDPEHVNIFLDNIGKILGATAGILLFLMKYTPKKKEAERARSVLTETPVSHAELLQCQMDVNSTISENFKDLRNELISEIKDIHKRIDAIQK